MPDSSRILAASSAGHSSSWRIAILALLVAITTAGITTCRFAPRFGLWRALPIGEDLPWALRHESELDRAIVSLAQLDDPWAPIANPTHQVIGWRLFFPVVWHYSHLERSWFLALPQIGCVLALWLVAWLSYERLGRWWPTWLATALLAALPWFFVSSSWLAHFDSWLVIGLLTAAFVPSRWPLLLVCLVTPWIDERFVLALPATMAVRAAALGRVEQQQWRELRLDLLVALAASVPYPAIRAMAWMRGDAVPMAYMKDHLEFVHTVVWSDFGQGLWSAYRFGWLLIVAAIFLIGRRVGWGWALAFAGLVLGTALGALFIARDVSRSSMMICPSFLLSIWLWDEWRVRAKLDLPSAKLITVAAMVLPMVLLANLTAPAYHVMWKRSWRVETLATEIHNWNHPPPLVLAGQELVRGRNLVRQGDIAEGLKCYDAAIVHADGAYPLALIERANLRIQKGDLTGAESDVNEALRLVPEYPFALLMRAAFRLDRGQTTQAIEDLQLALAKAPAGWPYREQAEALLEKTSNDRTR